MNEFNNSPQQDTKEIVLANVKMIKKQNINNQDYFIVFDNDGEQGNNAYFCFPSSTGLKPEQMERLDFNYQAISKIKLTYYEKEYNGRLGKCVVDFGLPANEFN